MTSGTAPVATVTGLYRGTFSGLEPLTKDTPLTRDEVREKPVFFEIELWDEEADLITDMSYDNMAPARLPDLFRGTDIPRGIRFWPGWFEVPPYREMRDVTGRRVYPRAPGIHTVRIRTAQRPRSPAVRTRDFSPENRGYTSPLFEFVIAAESVGPSERGEENNGVCQARGRRNPPGLRPDAPAFSGTPEAADVG
jgi:hypothetical protein